MPRNAIQWLLHAFGASLHPALILLTLAIALAHEAAWGAGFGVDFEDARAVGTATAGSAAAQGASTIFYNAAGLGFLERDEAIAGGQLFLLHDTFQNGGSTILGGLEATPGNNGDDAIPPTLVPWLYATYRFLPEWTAGIGVYSPFGLRTDYGPLWVGRYQNEVTSLTAINLNPSISYRPLSWLAIGGGLDVQYASVRLTQAIDFGSICAGALRPGACAGDFGLVAGASDGQVDNRGSGFGYGYNFGVLLEPFPGTRVGVAYRSEIIERISGGRQSFTVPAGAQAFLAAGGTPLAFSGSSISTSLQLPARLTFGLKQSLTPRLDLLLDATLTFWNVFDRTSVTAQNEVTGASVVIQQGYRNAWRLAAGLQWKVDERWQLRTGAAYDQTPIPASAVQAALPDADRVYLSGGVSYEFGSGWGSDFGYSHVFYVEKVGIDRSANSNTLKGMFSSGGDVIAGQMRLRY
jgi:long-chain fatty acid transport protein